MLFKVFITALLLGFAELVLSAGCPRAENIRPCTCTGTDVLSVYCQNVQISQYTLRNILNLFDKRKKLDIYLLGLKLESIPSLYFEGLHIRRLTINGSSLDRLAEEGKKPFTDLDDTLEMVRIINNSTGRIVLTKFPIDHLRRLNYLLLNRISISELSNDWFEKGPSSIKTLGITNCRIPKLGNKAFANLGNITTFKLVGNRFGSMARSMLPNPATFLQFLTLDNNMLDNFPEDFFSGMPSLYQLSLVQNRFTVLPQNTFLPIWKQLTYFSLKDNLLFCEDHLLKWMYDLNYDPPLEATCFAPYNRSGRNLRDLIQKKGKGFATRK